jgi:serine/threonine protein kinase/tetratricopeptide (TPR) repeat protein
MSDGLEGLRAALADRYELGRELGRGGMATVFQAADRRHGREVAIKVLEPGLSRTLGVERFLSEIRIAAGLTHPHILTVHDSGEADGLLFYVMPYVEGPTLRGRLDREKRLTVREAVRVARELAGALAFAHGRGIVHLDVKPENVLFEAGHAILTDFGVARAVNAAGGERPPAGESGVGTPAYMSPETCAGAADLDGRTDEYALACVLYEMLAGQPPFVAASPAALAARHLYDEVPPLRTQRPDAPPPVVSAVHRALAKDPGGRFPTVADFAASLEAPADAPVEGPRSVAVLPFANLSPNPDDGYLGDGLTEEILTALSKLRDLRVASRTSAFQYKERNEDIRLIGERLGVEAVLEGSVRREGTRLRVTAQLIDVAGGYHLWSEKFDREMADVFAIEDEIAQNIAGALRVVLGDRERRALGRVPTTDVRAYEFYLRGRRFFGESRRRSLAYAVEMFERAIAVDPSYALAWAGVADVGSLIAMYYPPGEVELARADEASRRALELAPDLAEAHAARGFALWLLKRVDEADREFETAIRLDPQEFEARYFWARSRFQRGQTEQAARLFEEAAAVREDYQARFFAAQSYASLGRAAEAEAAYRRAAQVAADHLALNPDDPRAYTMCAVALCRTGQPEQGLACAQRAVEVDPEDAGVCYNVACLYSLEGRVEDALRCLEDAFRHGFGDKGWIEHDPDLEPLRGEPRFQALLAHK